MKHDLRIITIGVFGFDEESFFSALTGAGVDTFCDIRSRRGLRGSKYAFANSTRLQSRLSVLGIRYLHLKDLAPPQEVRDVQKRDDSLQGISKRNRDVLGSGFISAYANACLQDFTASCFLNAVGPEARAVALFCVEREPRACHRSIVADRLKGELDVPVDDLMP